LKRTNAEFSPEVMARAREYMGQLGLDANNGDSWRILAAELMRERERDIANKLRKRTLTPPEEMHAIYSVWRIYHDDQISERKAHKKACDSGEISIAWRLYMDVKKRQPGYAGLLWGLRPLRET